MELPLYQVDAFTSKPFAGNPAAVCLLENSMPDAWMLSLAQEMNLSETAFLLPEGDGYRLRWFTPAVEVSLCGHATLAGAHILFSTGRVLAGSTIHFQSRCGLLTATQLQDWIELDFPFRPPQPVDPPAGLREALGITTGQWFSHKDGSYLCEVADDAAVRAAQPDFIRLKALAGVRAVCITARSADPQFDFISRFFAPKMGINEDPVTGSAHSVLAPYWAVRLKQTEFNAFQASTRGGVLKVRLAGERVKIAGQAVTVFSGCLQV